MKTITTAGRLDKKKHISENWMDELQLMQFSAPEYLDIDAFPQISCE